MKHTPKEEQPHWRKKKIFSFTEDDVARLERLVGRMERMRPGITQSQVVRVALTVLEQASQHELMDALNQTPEPRMGFEPKSRIKKLDCNEYQQLLKESELT